MKQLSIKLDAFEGPLDLLLTLIKKNKIDIYDIPIALVLEQYMGTIEDMKNMNLELSSEFLVLAATLLQIKSKLLLPKYDDEDGEQTDPREELVRRLLEYQKYKEATKFLTSVENSGNLSYYKSPDFIEPIDGAFNYGRLTPRNLHTAYKQAFSKLERRTPPPKHSFTGIVGHEKVSVRDRARILWGILIGKSKLLLKDVFFGVKNRPEAVASFLAVLELIRLRKIKVDYKKDGTPLLSPLSVASEIDIEDFETPD